MIHFNTPLIVRGHKTFILVLLQTTSMVRFAPRLDENARLLHFQQLSKPSSAVDRNSYWVAVPLVEEMLHRHLDIQI